MSRFDMDTLIEAKQALRAGWVKGLDCPCCGQRVQIYDRQIYKTMVKEFIRLAQHCNGNDDFHHIKKYRTVGGGDMVKMRYWGLIQEKPNENQKTRSSGYWRLTRKGWQYLRGEISVPKYAWTFDSKAKYFTGPEVTISDGLGTAFDYRELMGF